MFKFTGTEEAGDCVFAGHAKDGMLSVVLERTGKDTFRVTGQCKGVDILEHPDIYIRKGDYLTLSGVYIKLEIS